MITAEKITTVYIDGNTYNIYKAGELGSCLSGAEGAPLTDEQKNKYIGIKVVDCKSAGNTPLGDTISDVLFGLRCQYDWQLKKLIDAGDWLSAVQRRQELKNA